MFWVNLAHANQFMPPQASTFAESFDNLYWFLLIASVISCVLVIGGFIYLTIRYRRRSETDKTAYIPHNAFLEFLWSFIPFVIFMVAFAWGWIVFHDMRTMPEDALEVHVVGQKWSWDFVYKSGKRSSNNLYVPVNTPVKLIMASKDVLHSFSIPGFRVKQDVVPGRYTALWFEATKVGKFQVFCTEFCGTGHSAMLAKLHVLPVKEYEKWLENDPYKNLSMVEVGEKVFEAKCAVCHNVTDARKVGPGFGGLWMAERKFTDGSTAVSDANYIRESILNPNKKIVETYPAAMPTFAGQLAEEELTGIIEFIKTLKK